jgi:hypothetical protein
LRESKPNSSAPANCISIRTDFDGNAALPGTVANAGGGGSHNHTGNLSSATTDINVQYVDVIIATKN